MQEHELIQSARAGDSTAWNALVQAHREPVFRFAYLLLHDPAEAEDAAQETFVRAYRAFDSFDADRRLQPWLFGIAANVARNRKRSLGRYAAAVQRFISRRTPAQQPVEQRTEARLEAETLWRAVRRLKQADQAVLYLRYFLDLSVQETAESLDVAPGTVKSRTFRALDRLRAVIREEFPELETEANE